MALTQPAKKRLRSLGLNALVLVAAWVLIGAYQTRRHVGASAAAAPSFTLQDLSGREVSLRDFAGKKVLLHFFATWCGVCRVELPSVRGIHGSLGPDEVLIAVADDSDDAETLRRYAREHGLEYPILLGTPEVLEAYGVNVFPTNYYLNGDGTVDSSTAGLSTRVGMGLRLLAADGGG